MGHQVTGGSFENLAMRWNGSQWSAVPTPRVSISSTNQLKKVTALSSNNVWAIGGHELPYALNWNGSTWSVVNFPAVTDGDPPSLNDIAAVSANDIWSVGHHWAHTGRVTTVIMRWDGAAWTRVPSPNVEIVAGSPRSSFLHSVEAVSANNVWAVGEYIVGNKSFPMIQHWNGTSWSIVPSPAHPTTNDGRLFGISVNSANDIWAVGEHDIASFNTFGKSLALHWDGSQWSYVSTPHPGAQNGTSRLSSVKAISADNAWAVGSASNAAQGLTTFIIHWNGTQWSRVATPNVPPENSTGWNQLHDISAVSRNDIWAVGQGQSTFNAPNVTITERYTDAAANRTEFDFDGDRKADPSIFRASLGEWWINRSTGGAGAWRFGAASDKVAAADFTGDGKTDAAVWRESNGEWLVLRSEDSTFYAFPFGAAGDVPAHADYDGDGRADVAVFRPSNSVWYVSASSGGTTIWQFGQSGDRPAPGDYDGDGSGDFAIYRPDTGEWWIESSSDNLVRVFQFGSADDRPVQADYTGDGKVDVAVFRPSTGEWLVLRSEDRSYYSFPFGISTDRPVPADYDGDGRTDAAVYREGVWHIQRSSSGYTAFQFGIASDIPVPSRQ